MVRPLKVIARDERYGEALALLVAVYLLGAVNWGWIPQLSDALFIIILLMIVLQPSVPRKLRYTAVGAASISAACSGLAGLQDSATADIMNALSSCVVVAMTVVAVVRRLLLHDTVNATTVMGAILCYALLAFGASYVYLALQAATGEPFFNQGQVPTSDFVYFAFVTLTTVGFGDLTPAGDLAKRLVAVEALGGQIFLVVLVARLVALWAPPKRDRTPEE